jgi:hypothetical protein
MGWQKQVLGWWCAALLAPATAQQIEFPLSHYSFEEIARHMSVAGRRVSCAPEVRQRLALIYLKPRSWREARALLERALEVQFRRVSDGDWILERDPAIVGRERRLRERLARALEEQAAFQTRLLHACLDSKVPADRAATHLVRLRYAHLPPSAQQAHWARLRDEIAHAQEMPLKAALRNWRAYEWFSSEFSRFHARGRLQEFLRKYPLASFGFSEEERRWAVREAQRWRERWAPKLGHAVLKTDDPARGAGASTPLLGTSRAGVDACVGVRGHPVSAASAAPCARSAGAWAARARADLAGCRQRSPRGCVKTLRGYMSRFTRRKMCPYTSRYAPLGATTAAMPTKSR